MSLTDLLMTKTPHETSAARPGRRVVLVVNEKLELLTRTGTATRIEYTIVRQPPCKPGSEGKVTEARLVPGLPGLWRIEANADGWTLPIDLVVVTKRFLERMGPAHMVGTDRMTVARAVFRDDRVTHAGIIAMLESDEPRPPLARLWGSDNAAGFSLAHYGSSGEYAGPRAA